MDGSARVGGARARTDTTSRETVTTWTAATGMAMAATGMVAAAIRPSVAATGKAKAAPVKVPTGTIAAGMAADLVSIKGRRCIEATYNHLQNTTDA